MGMLLNIEVSGDLNVKLCEMRSYWGNILWAPRVSNSIDFNAYIVFSAEN